VTSSPSDPIQAPPATAAPKPNAFARMAGVLTSPNATFRDIAQRPDVLIPLLTIVALSVVGVALLVPHVDFAATYREAFDGMNLPPDRMEKSIRMAAGIGKATIYFSPVLQLIAFAIIAGILLIAFRMFGGEGDYKQAFSVTLYSWMPMVIKGILSVIVILSRKTITLNDLANPLRSNLAFLVNMKQQPLLFSLFGSLDIFTIWTMILMIIGFAALSRFSKVKSAAIIVSLWLLVVFVKLGFAAIGANARAKA
jgi:hypothetical protein